MESIKIILNDNIKFIVVAFVAFGVDTITGITRAILNKNVQSSKLKKTIIKFIVYFGAIVLGGCAEILFPTDKTFKIQVVCLVIFATDGWSFIENSRDIINIPFIKEFFEKIKTK